MNALFESILARQEKLQAVTKSQDGFYVPSFRGYVTPISKDKLAYSTADSMLMESTIDEKKMSATFIVSTVEPDRDGDIVPPQSCMTLLDHYRANPVVFFGHQEKVWLPIASSESPSGEFCFWPDPQKGIITSTGYFHCKTPESHQIFGLVASKQLRAASLGFAPVEAERRNAQKGNNSYNQQPGQSGKRAASVRGFLFHQIDVIEWSVVGVPMNSEAIAIGLSKGMLFGDKISRVMRHALQPYAVPRSGAVRSGYNPKKGNDMNIQSILLSKKAYKAPQEAAAFVKERDLDASDMEETDDSYVFHQVPADQCEGLKESNLFKGIAYQNASFVDYDTRKKGAEAPAQDEKQPSEAEPSAAMPQGAQFLQGVSASLDGLTTLLQQHSGLLEHPPVKEACMKGLDEASGYRKGLDGMMKKEYPDVDFGVGADKDADEDTMTPAQKRYKCLCAKAASEMNETVVGDDEKTDDQEQPEELVKKLGPRFIAKMVGHGDATLASLTSQMPSLEHPVIKEMGDAICNAIPERRAEMVGMMAKEYPEAHKAFGWGDADDAPADDEDDDEESAPGDGDDEDESEEDTESKSEAKKDDKKDDKKSEGKDDKKSDAKKDDKETEGQADKKKDDAEDKKKKKLEKGLTVQIKTNGKWITHKGDLTFIQASEIYNDLVKKQVMVRMTKQFVPTKKEAPAEPPVLPDESTDNNGLMGEISKVFMEMGQKLTELAQKLGSSMDVDSTDQNPYQDTGKPDPVTKQDDDEEEKELTNDQMKQLLDTANELKEEATNQKRLWGYMTSNGKRR